MLNSLCIFAIISYTVSGTLCAPVQEFALYPVSYSYGQVKQMNPIQEWIMNTEWLPIEINVPDTISNIASSISGAAGSILQRIPFINRFVSQETPRPFQYVLLVPVAVPKVPQQQQQQQKKLYGNPFSAAENEFAAVYP